MRSKKNKTKGPAPVAAVTTVAGGRTPVRLAATICVSLSVVTLLVYLQTFRYGFVYFDDDRYVSENAMLKAGLSAKGLAWAFTTFYYSLWHPLTWISYLLDYQLFGINAGVEHAVNVMFHLGAVVLLYLALLEMTQKPWRCAVVAGIFALHPLHVESVAWIAERKDVLSTFLEMLALLLYARYASKPTLKRYGLMAAAFLLSLLAKPMAASLPFVFLLLDVWPLRRAGFTKLIWEKTPLFAMSAGASVLTFMAQRSNGAVSSLTSVPFLERIENAAVTYVAYLGKAFWPVDLAVLYPLRSPPAAAVFGALLVLIAITSVAIATFRGHPYILIGWLWYLGMLVPVIGIVQVGLTAMADRFTYVPLVGFSIALVWTVAEAVKDSPALRQTAAALAGVFLVAMAVVAYRQAGYWNDSETLFRHTLEVTSNNSVIENNLGVVLARQGKYEEAKALYLRALATDPKYADAHENLGRERLRAGQVPEALKELSEALRLKPGTPETHADLGVALAASGQFAEASQHLEEAARSNPDDATVQSNLCFVLQHLNRLDQAIAACRAAIRINPSSVDARFNLGNVLAAGGRNEEAAAEFSRLLQTNPNYQPARVALDKLRH